MCTYVVGASGKLGHAIGWIACRHELDIIPLPRYQLDLSEPEEKWFQIPTGSTVINCAWSSEDGGEAVNVRGSIQLASRCYRDGVRYIGISSDSLWNDHLTGSVDVRTPITPVTDFQKQKAAMEEGVLEVNPTAVIVRCSYIGWSPKRPGRIGELINGHVISCENRPWNGVFSTCLACVLLSLPSSVRGLHIVGAQNPGTLSGAYSKVAGALPLAGAVLLQRPTQRYTVVPTIAACSHIVDGLARFVQYLSESTRGVRLESHAELTRRQRSTRT